MREIIIATDAGYLVHQHMDRNYPGATIIRVIPATDENGKPASKVLFIPKT